MAKAKKDDTPTDLPPDAGDGIERADGGDAPLAEDERAELLRLRALFADKDRPAAVAPAGRVTKWLGTIRHGVPIVVEAADQLHAVEAYKRAAGIIHSEHPIEVGPAPEGAELGPVNK